MDKKIISIAATAICTLSISVTALGAVNNQYILKLCSPTFSYITSNGNELSEKLNSCIEKLNEQMAKCDKDLPENNFSDPCPDKNDPPLQEEEKPALPETNNPSEEGDTPSADENIIISSNQTAKEAALAAEVVDLVNKERASRGLNALSQDPSLQAAAQKRSQEQTVNFSHTRPNGNSCFSVLPEYGITYNGAGENIAFGQETPAEVVKAWMNSEGHKSNIISENFTDIGVGCYISPSGTIYWSQMFIY